MINWHLDSRNASGLECSPFRPRIPKVECRASTEPGRHLEAWDFEFLG